MIRSLLAVVTAAVPSPAAPAAVAPEQLLIRYQPVLRLAAGEQFRPTTAERFVAASDLEARAADGRWLASAPATTPPADPPGCVSSRAAPCWRLNLRACTPDAGIASLACYAAAEAAELSAFGYVSTVYGRVARTRNRIVLQYWYLYSFNFWSAANPPSDFVWRSHEGDWELVAVVLSRDERPLELALSQHCGGRRRAWAKVRTWRRTHPVVFVALGSHAGYFGPGRYRHDPRCYPQAANVVFRVNGVAPLDHAGDGVTLIPPEVPLTVVSSRSPAWMAFPGWWGERGYFHAPGVETIAFGAGPEGPAFHATWTDVRRTILRWRSG